MPFLSLTHSRLKGSEKERERERERDAQGRLVRPCISRLMYAKMFPSGPNFSHTTGTSERDATLYVCVYVYTGFSCFTCAPYPPFLIDPHTLSRGYLLLYYTPISACISPSAVEMLSLPLSPSLYLPAALFPRVREIHTRVYIHTGRDVFFSLFLLALAYMCIGGPRCRWMHL